MDLNELLERTPDMVSPFEDEGVTNEEYQLAVTLMESGVFSGSFPPELFSSLFRMVPGANPAV
jgi:hypothetical protein